MSSAARWIDNDRDLFDVIEEVRGEPRYSLDTEFHRERTYFPRLALVQIAWSDQIALIDPLACEGRMLAPLLESDSLCVAHAAQQDLDVLTHAVGSVPRRLFDTQLAAGFIGYSSPSLVSLLAGELRIQVPKGDRLTDWLRRPLTADQRDYAAGDVAHLFELQDRIVAKLNARGRLEWAHEACEELRVRPQGLGDPYDAWLKLKDVRTLKPRGRAVARAVAAWRERRAAQLDIPVRHVLADLGVLAIAQRAPKTESELGSCRGVDERNSRGAQARDLLAAVAEGASLEADLPSSDGDELDRRLRPAVTLVSAWVSEVGRQEKIDPMLLATRSDLTAFLAGDSSARLAAGWRHQLLGANVHRLVRGDAAMAFDGKGGMRLLDVVNGAAVAAPEVPSSEEIGGAEPDDGTELGTERDATADSSDAACEAAADAAEAATPG